MHVTCTYEPQLKEHLHQFITGKKWDWNQEQDLYEKRHAHSGWAKILSQVDFK